MRGPGNEVGDFIPVLRYILVSLLKVLTHAASLLPLGICYAGLPVVSVGPWTLTYSVLVLSLTAFLL